MRLGRQQLKEYNCAFLISGRSPVACEGLHNIAKLRIARVALLRSYCIPIIRIELSSYRNYWMPLLLVVSFSGRFGLKNDKVSGLIRGFCVLGAIKHNQDYFTTLNEDFI